MKNLALLLSPGGPFLPAAGPAPAGEFPLWDGKEGVADTAKRARLEPTLTLDMGGVKWEGVLIPAGAFVMGSPPGEAKTEKESAIAGVRPAPTRPGNGPSPSRREGSRNGGRGHGGAR